MLNEFSDRAPKGKAKPFIMSGEFWLGVISALIGIAVILNFVV